MKKMKGTIAFAASLLGAAAACEAASPLAFFNSADSDKAYPIAESGPTPIASVESDISAFKRSFSILKRRDSGEGNWLSLLDQSFPSHGWRHADAGQTH
ncbi:MAG: hypothetical protein K2P80_03425 [Beijerinckiaceae bacterium]|nr:hypothetical protein [Beijerinckiaceae bacterium]